MSFNISSNNVAGNCNLKCDLAVNYPPTSCPVYHESMGLTIKADATTVPPATYNSIKYIPDEMIIQTPSGLFYNEKRAVGDIMIRHHSSDYSSYLMIIIPIIESNSLTDVSHFMSDIISAVSSAAPAVGNSTTVNMNNFSFGAFVPNKPFYTFNVWSYNVVAFGLESALPLSKSNLATLTSFFKDSPYKITDTYNNKDNPFKDVQIYKNTHGLSSIAAGDIYIDCKPVNESEETTNVPVKKVYDYGFTLDDILNNPIFLALVASIVIVAFLMLLRMGIKQMSAFEF